MDDSKKPGKLRVYYHEWSSTEGTRGNRNINVWLSAVSLSDFGDNDIPTTEHVETALASIGGALLTSCLDSDAPEPALLNGVRGAEVLGHTMELSSKAAGFFGRQRREADKLGVPALTPQQAVGALKAAIGRAWESRERTIAALPTPASLRFTQLFTYFGLDPQEDD
jgi:hypothetical protein